MDIDFVVPWVDGNDPLWQAEKVIYQEDTVNETNSANRFRDWNLMKYWFRSIEKFTPWVRKIHFVTWGHIPEFLNTNHPKIHIVKHEDYLPEYARPTFSSHVIELNLHRIEGLSEHFVYLNDDTFIIRNMEPEKFFKDGLPCTMGCESPIELIGDIGIWQHAAVNDLGIINKHFSKKAQIAKYRKKYINKAYSFRTNLRTICVEQLFPNGFTGFRNLHAPAAYLKSTFENVWQKETELLTEISGHKFRTPSDLNQWVMLWWQVASGNFTPAIVDSETVLSNQENINQIKQILTGQTHDMVCINDPVEDIDFEELSRQLIEAFETILPEKSSFEK